MESTAHLYVPAAKVARYETNSSLCVICQEDTGEALVEKPNSHEKVFDFIQKRARYGDGKYLEIKRNIGDVSWEDLQTRSATSHRTCYQNTTHTGMCKRAEKKYKKELSDRVHKNEVSNIHASCSTFTRSKSTPYERDICFFCEQGESYGNLLHEVKSDNAGRFLEQVIEKARSEKLMVKLCTAINLEDALAMKIKNHKCCWAANVTNVLCKETDNPTTEGSTAVDYAAEVEFLSLLDGELMDGNIFSMSVLQNAYQNIMSANNVQDPTYSRKRLKMLIQIQIPDTEFHHPKRVNESERVSSKRARDAAMQLAEESSLADDMNLLYKAALVLRNKIELSKPWEFQGSLTDINDEHLPKELYSFYHWVLEGPKTSLSSDFQSAFVSKNAQSLAQTTVSMYLSKYQIQRTNAQCFKSTREMPQQLAIGLAICQAIRSKFVINLLHDFGVTLEYNRLLCIEAQIANSVLQRICDDVYIPPDIIKNRHINFAIDNIDFSEDTPNGKIMTQPLLFTRNVMIMIYHLM